MEKLHRSLRKAMDFRKEWLSSHGFELAESAFSNLLSELGSEFRRVEDEGKNSSTYDSTKTPYPSTPIRRRAKADYDKFVQQYKNTVPFYTYTPKGEKTNAYVIKGLYEDVEEDDIKNELLELRVQIRNAYVIKGLYEDVEEDDIKNELLELRVQISAVTRFKRSKYPIFMCVVKRSVTLKDLQKAGRYLQHTRVYYEPHTSKKEATQRHKCQQWGHATANCYLSVVRCVKCGQGHKTTACTLPRDQPAKCCNCDEAHPASSSKCSAYIKFLESREQKRTKNGAASAARAASPASPTAHEQTMPSPSTSSPAQAPAERARTTGARSMPPPAVDEDLNSMSEIADIMRDIKRMVNLKAVAVGLRALKEKLQGCRNNFEKAMAIDEFNAGDF
ncbi:hypothetical protein QE152_g15252 [Popillia japonica]|uniref:Nucleic-acid-binding protein from transposon X-element n=1 Tax=Popillia japonica TaxID=7064 RepID=A0AAW1L8N8_POPJA